MLRSLPARRLPKPLAVVLTVALALFWVLAVPPTSADAANGGFPIDGNRSPMPAGTQTVSDPIGNTDTTVYSNGAKEGEPWTWKVNGSAGAPNSGDIGGSYIATGYDGDFWLYYAFDRAAPNGTIAYVLELNQKSNSTNSYGTAVPTRTVGDLRFSVEQAGSGAFRLNGVERWSGSGWVRYTVPGSAMDYAVSSDTTFVEFAFNLTAILKGGGKIECGDLAFTNLWLRSRSSDSDESQLKDFATGAVNVDSCAGLKVQKVDVEGNGLAGATFRISPNPKPNTSGDLTVKTGADGFVDLHQINSGTYSVTELAPPAGYLIDTAEKQIKINPTEDGYLKFTNSLGSVAFTKTYEGAQPATGATFRLDYAKGWDFGSNPPVLDAKYAGDFGPVIVVDNGDRDADKALGKIRVANVPSGEWTITETAAPAGWDTDKRVETFRVGPSTAQAEGAFVAPSTGTFTNPLVTAALRVVKTESSAGTQAPLSGVVFDLFKDNGDGVPQLGVNGGDTLVATVPTDSAGLANWTGLNWQNKYWLREKVPAGYGTSLEPNPKLITLDVPSHANQVTTVDVDNPRQELTVSFNKTDASNGAKLTGGSFELWRDANGNGKWDEGVDRKVGASKALEDGNATWTPDDGDLPWGYVYFVYERTAPDGYGLMSPNPAATGRTTPVDAGKTVSVSAMDPRLTVDLTMKKVDDFGEPVAKASFQLYRDNGDGSFGAADTPIGSPRLSGIDGSLSWAGLGWDAVYWVEETEAPQGYSAMTENPVKVTVEKVHAGKTLDLTGKPLVNPRVPTSLDVLKVDELDQTPLEGAVFSLWHDVDKDGRISGPDTPLGDSGPTGADGKVFFDKKMVWENQYLLVETKAPDGYDLIGPLVVTVDKAEAGKTIKRTVENPRTSAGLQVRKSDEDKPDLPVSGAKFKLWQDANQDGKFNPCDEVPNGLCDLPMGGVHETGAGGLAPAWTGLTYGYTYFVQEVSTPQGYTGIALETVRLERSDANKVVVVDITNPRDAADLVITKVDGTTKSTIDGAKFELRRGGSATEPGTLIAEGTVASGSLRFSNSLVWGYDYWLYETDSGSANHSLMTPNPLKIEHAATAAEFERVVELTVENPRKPSGVVVQKVDEHNDSAVEGATFELYVDRDGSGTVNEADGSAIGTGTTAATGTVEFTGLTWGVDYLLLETNVPAGYQAIQPNPHPFTLDGPGTKVLTLEEPRLTAGATMKKVDEYGTPVDGAQFDLYLDNGDGRFDASTDTKVAGSSTGADGVLNWSELHWGEKYWVYESVAPEGYQVMADNPRPITVTRKDAGTVIDLTSAPMVDPRAPASLTALKVDGLNGDPLAGAKFTLWLDRDNDGAVTTADKPSVAESTTGADGLIRFTDKLVWGNQYLLQETAAPEGYEAMSPNPIVVKVTKDHAGRVIDLTATPLKDPRATTDLKVLKVDATDDRPLPRAEFTLWLDTDGNGKLSDGDDVIASQPSNSDGVAVFKGLIWGNQYLVQETTAPAGYDLMDPNPAVVTIGKHQAGTTIELKVADPRQPSSLQVLKIDGHNQSALDGAEFMLWLDTDKDGTVNIGDEHVATAISGQDGLVVFTNQLVWGHEYLLQETKAPEGYGFMTPNPLSVKPSRDEAGKTLEVTVEDPRTPAGIQVRKTDQDADGIPVPGATFRLWLDDGNGRFAPCDAAVNVADAGDGCDTLVGDERTTDGNGLTETWTGLTYGHVYFVEEVEAPTGYDMVEPQRVELTRDDANKVVLVEIEDPRAMSSLEVLKVDATDGTPLSGAEFALWRDSDGNGQVNDGDERVATATTGTDGRMLFTDRVVWGTDYLLEETKAPEGYGFMTPNPLPVTVTQDQAGKTVQLAVKDPRLPNPGIEKVSDPQSGSVVQPGTLITYSVTASNTGGMPIPSDEAVVVDTLPNGLWFEGMVAADPAQPEPQLTLNDDGTTTLRWQIGELAAGKSLTLRYEAVVLDDVPQGTVLENEAEFLDMRDTTTHLVPTGDLAIVKTANPPSGNFVLVGDEITYTMTVTASGELDQRDVVVADYVPGTDPDLSESVKTTYVEGSAKCSGDCLITEPGADGMVIWELGNLPAGQSRSVSFTVKVNAVNASGTGTVQVGDVLNVAWVESVAVPPTASNRTEHPVSVVLGTKVTNPQKPTPAKPGTAPVRHTPPVKTAGKNLPRTGAEIGTALWLGGALLLLGGALVVVTRDRRRPVHRQ